MSWEDYYKKTKSNPPRPLLLMALDAIEKSAPHAEPLAIDLGSGAGQDTMELLRRGWKVLAIDSNPNAIEILSGKAQSAGAHRLETRAAPFEKIQSLPASHLVYASLSLPFCAKEAFPLLWNSITQCLNPGGWLAANFFGPEDDWVKDASVNGHSLEETQELFRSMRIDWLDEKKERAPTALGDTKHWHIISVIAQKN